MRTIIVAETPGKYISFSFEELRRNKKELKKDQNDIKIITLK